MYQHRIYLLRFRSRPFRTLREPGVPPSQAPGLVLQPVTGFFGWLAICWAVFFCYLWIASFKAGVLRVLFLVFLWLALLSEALGAWGGSMTLVMLGAIC